MRYTFPELKRIVGGRDPHRRILCYWMHRSLDMTEAEIGDALGISHQTVHEHRNNVRLALSEAEVIEQDAVDTIEASVG